MKTFFEKGLSDSKGTLMVWILALIFCIVTLFIPMFQIWGPTGTMGSPPESPVIWDFLVGMKVGPYFTGLVGAFATAALIIGIANDGPGYVPGVVMLLIDLGAAAFMLIFASWDFIYSFLPVLIGLAAGFFPGIVFGITARMKNRGPVIGAFVMNGIIGLGGFFFINPTFPNENEIIWAEIACLLFGVFVLIAGWGNIEDIDSKKKYRGVNGKKEYYPGVDLRRATVQKKHSKGYYPGVKDSKASPQRKNDKNFSWWQMRRLGREADRREREAEKVRKVEEEIRQRQEEMARLRRVDEEQRQREESERRQNVEEEQRQREESERRQKAEEERRQREESERRQKAEKERRQREESERRQKAEEERRQREEAEHRRQEELERTSLHWGGFRFQDISKASNLIQGSLREELLENLPNLIKWLDTQQNQKDMAKDLTYLADWINLYPPESGETWFRQMILYVMNGRSIHSLFESLHAQIPQIEDLTKKFVYTQLKRVQNQLNSASSDTIDGIILQNLQSRWKDFLQLLDLMKVTFNVDLVPIIWHQIIQNAQPLWEEFRRTVKDYEDQAKQKALYEAELKRVQDLKALSKDLLEEDITRPEDMQKVMELKPLPDMIDELLKNFDSWGKPEAKKKLDK